MGMQAPVTDFQGGFGRLAQGVQQLGQIGDKGIEYAQLKKKLGDFDATKGEYAEEVMSSLPDSYTPRSKRMLSMSIKSIQEPSEFVEKVRDFELQRQYHSKNTKGLQPQFGMSVDNWLKLREEGNQKQDAQQLGQASRDVAAGAGLASPVQDPTTGEEAFTEQSFGPPPQTQEQALGKFAEFQSAGQAPEASVKDVLGQPAIGQLPKQRELDVQKRFEERQQIQKDRMDAQKEQWKAGVSRTRNEKMRKGQEGNLKWAIGHVDAIEKEKDKLERELAKVQGKASDPTNLGDYSASTGTLETQIEELDKELKAYSQVAGTISSPEGAALNQKQVESMLQQLLGSRTGNAPPPTGGLGNPSRGGGF